MDSSQSTEPVLCAAGCGFFGWFGRASLQTNKQTNNERRREGGREEEDEEEEEEKEMEGEEGNQVAACSCLASSLPPIFWHGG